MIKVDTRHLTVKQFLSGQINRDLLRLKIDESFAFIKKNRRDLFSVQNAGWTIKWAKEEIKKHKVVLASDHAGFRAKEFAKIVLEELGVQYEDYGPYKVSGTLDFPIYVVSPIERLLNKEADRAILCCGSGTGFMLAANRFPGIMAAKGVHPHDVARAREHNDINVLTLGERVLADREMTIDNAVRSIMLFLSTPFIVKPHRYAGRIEQISAIQGLALQAAGKGLLSITDLEKEFNAAVRNNPGLAEIWYVRGMAHLANKRFERAMADLRKYVDSAFDSNKYEENLATLKIRLEVLLTEDNVPKDKIVELIDQIAKALSSADE